ncbi:hypothetical protein [Mycobacterium servetii]|uniref:Uncharacterized protein n=1 Tax=Mycobacterium servetii TaxID=3237418 RepID=A0ABV4CCB8_9MYCO
MPKKRSGRAAAERAYADLIRDKTRLVGDVGDTFEALTAALTAAAAQRERYEQARAAAIKNGAATSEQLDQLGYRKTTKTVTLPASEDSSAKAGRGATSDDEGGITDRAGVDAVSEPEPAADTGGDGGDARTDVLAGVGAGTDGGQH